MAPNPKVLLDSVAEAVSDGEAVDWSAADSHTNHQGTRHLLRQLRLIADIAGVHRGASEQGDAGTAAALTSSGGATQRAGLLPAKTLLPRKQWGHLQLREVLGHGAYGVVFRAWDSRLDREVALKLIPDLSDRSYAEGVIHEARLMARINHHGVVTIYGAARMDGFVGLWMELVEGQTLEADLRQRGRLSAREAALVGLDVCEALAAVHGAGLLHRDIKAQNVMRDRRDGRIVLMDFGAGRERPLPGGVEVADLAGTPLCMAPELFRRGAASLRSDIYSVGVLLFRLVTGKAPIAARSIDDVRRAHETGEVRRLRDERSNLPAGFVHIVERALSPDATKRYGSVGELEQALNGFISGGQERTRPATTRTRWYDSPRWVVLGGLAALLVVLTFVWLALRGPERGAGDALPRIAFAVYPPPGGEFDSLAISPDGTRLAFESEGRLWIRALSGVQATDVNNSNGGVDPFWSPDGRYIAFFKSGRLWKVSADGGEPAVLCDAPRALGGSWGPNNTILFAGEHGEAIYRVSAYGDAPQALRTAGENGLYEFRWPVVLPSGNGFVYSAQEGPEARRAVYFARFDGTTDRALVTSNSNAYATNEALFYLKQGVLYAHPFDSERGRLTGEPTQIGHRLDPSPYQQFHAEYTVSPEGVVAYRGGRQVDRELRIVDRAGRTLRVLGEPGEFRDIAVSHDGTRLAYEERDAAAGTTDIWVVDIERGGRTQITWGAGDDTCPVWSVDDRHLLFLAHGEGYPRLFRKSADGNGRATELFQFQADVQPFDVSADGRWLAFQRLGHQTTWDIHLLNLLAPPERAALGSARDEADPSSGRIDERMTIFHRTPHADDEPRFSPGGRFLAYSSRDSGDRFVFFEEVDRTTGQRWRVSPSYGRQPQWRADGREIYYHGANRMLMAAPIDLSGEAPRVGSPTPLFELAFRGWDLRYHYAAFPDGQRFVLNAPREGSLPLPATIVLNWDK
ncbi:MAG: protein kinase domain-containing protein [Vicinamibacteraceae bacterium]